MKITFIAIVALLSYQLLSVTDQCRSIRLADIGWTDVTATTAVAEELLIALSYEPKVSVLSIPVTFMGLKNNDLDIFLGNWMPSQEADIRPYLDEASVVQIHQNLRGARYSLAVPDYVYEAGIRSFVDLATFASKFSHRIYGIESGNDGNRLIEAMIKANAFKLGDWQLVESSEQGMMVSVKQAVAEKQWIVFLGWAPHPMNLSLKMNYLSGGDEYFGPDFGASAVYTVARKNFTKDCPNLSQFFKRLSFTVEMENYLMGLIIEDDLSPREAAQRWLNEHQSIALSWLKGINDVHGRPAAVALKQHMASSGAKANNLELPIGDWVELGINLLTNNFSHQFRVVAHRIEIIIEAITNFLLNIHWLLLIFFFTVLSFFARRSWKLSLMVFMGLLLIVNLSLWSETIQTLVLVSLSALISIMIGLPIGIIAAHRPFIYKMIHPFLDLMQTVPTFVYLIPTLILFGLGVVPGLVSTIIFAIAAPIRLTYLGITQVPPDLLEAIDAFGATPWQRLIKVEIPSAWPSIMAGFSQCIMLSLSMVVIAALVGAEGLGEPVVRALNTVDIKLGCEAGIAIMIVAIILERVLTYRASAPSKTS